MFFVIADNQFTCWNITFVILGGLLFLDIFLANISIAFVAVTRAPINDLRSFFLTFTAFINIVVIYALFYKFLDQFNYAMCNPQLLYFSFVTITTLGYGDFVPQRSGTMSQIVVIMELLTGLIFIAGVFARIINTGRRTNK